MDYHGGIAAQIDLYKASHKDQYPKGTTLIVSNLTPRGSRIDGIDSVVNFGLQGFIKEHLIDGFGRFFDGPPSQISTLEEDLRLVLNDPNINLDHIRALHSLGYLPISIKALPEGHRVPLRVPMMCIYNTKPEFYWLTNYLETLISAELWKPITTATIAAKYRSVFNQYAIDTTDSLEGTNFQGHDFSMRGMSGVNDAAKCGAGHLLFSNGTDTLPAIYYLKNYYGATGFIGGSVPATEHSVACALGQSEIDNIQIEEYFDENTQEWKFLRAY